MGRHGYIGIAYSQCDVAAVCRVSKHRFKHRGDGDMNGDWWALVDQTIWPAVQILIAFVLALPIAYDRELESHSMGLRTFPLVAMASCGFVLIALNEQGSGSELVSRVMQGVITGVGFIGGGAILKGNASAHGTATAASLWNTSAVGAAVAFSRYDLAVILTLMNFITLRLLKPLKKSLREK